MSPSSQEHLLQSKKAIVAGIAVVAIAVAGLALVLVGAPVRRSGSAAARRLTRNQSSLPTSSRYPRVGLRYALAPGFIICRYEQGVIDFDTALIEKNKAGELGAITRYGCVPTQHVDAKVPVLFLSQTGVMRPLAKVRLSNGNPAWVDLAALEPGS